MRDRIRSARHAELATVGILSDGAFSSPSRPEQVPSPATPEQRRAFRKSFARAPAAAAYRLIDAIIPHGGAAEIAAAARRHLSAGADHVCLQTVGVDGIPRSQWTAIASALGADDVHRTGSASHRPARARLAVGRPERSTCAHPTSARRSTRASSGRAPRGTAGFAAPGRSGIEAVEKLSHRGQGRWRPRFARSPPAEPRAPAAAASRPARTCRTRDPRPASRPRPRSPRRSRDRTSTHRTDRASWLRAS
jgi:hypothetical protein